MMRSDRLLELAAHLKSDRRGHKIFDFTCFSNGLRDPERHGCGSQGCAFGELPVVWPEDWEFRESGIKADPNLPRSVRLKSQKYPYGNQYTAISGAIEWFDLKEQEVEVLFFSRKGFMLPGPVGPLPDNATAEEVADRFIAFVKWREQQAAQEVKTDG